MAWTLRPVRLAALCVALLGMLATLVPSTASAAGGNAFCYKSMEMCVAYPGSGTYTSYKGWAATERVACIPEAPGPCEARYDAWSWTGTTWQKSFRTSFTKVYVWPFTGGWVWTWTATSGWLAMDGVNLPIRLHCTSTPTDVFADATGCKPL